MKGLPRMLQTATKASIIGNMYRIDFRTKERLFSVGVKTGEIEVQLTFRHQKQIKPETDLHKQPII